MASHLDVERWRALSPKLDEALELDGRERADWLAALRSENRQLADDVESALRAHASAAGERFLEDRSAFGAFEPTDETPGSLAGVSLGAYTLRSAIGHGGMGSVWLAERTDGRYQGFAAVKLLNVSLIGGHGEARFRREGEILARLRHPHIAQLLDAGVSSAGQPYLVLEHVDGESIDGYCDRKALDLTERIRLLLDVLGAVAHAHARLIVHRDLKPSNVLVTRDGQVKLLDFGIAKLLDPQEGADAWGATREGHAAMTPAYAAPEQLTGGQVTTATDVYAIGVLLYQLLCGRHPIEGTERSAAEWIRSIVETEPMPPSEAAASPRSEAEPDAAAVAAQRSTTSQRLRSQLRGDLDNIVARAVAKRPEQRYSSVDALADDLRRHLDHRPVSARAQGTGYRLGKFVRRHWRGVLAAGLLTGAVLAGTVGIAWQARETRLQRDLAATQLARATATNEFLSFLLSVAAPGEERFSVTELLEQGEALVDKQFAGDEAMRAEMLLAIGEQYMDSERWDRARPVLERAAEVAQRTGDSALRARASCALASLVAANGDPPAAQTMIAAALDGLTDAPHQVLARADCVAYRAAIGYFTENAESMIRDAQLAMELYDTSPIAPATARINARATLAYGYYLARRNREADREYAQLHAELVRVGRDRTVMAADLFNNWALVHFLGDIARAETLTRQALELRRSIEAPQSMSPTTVFNLAGILYQLGRWEEAERSLEETIRTAAAREEQRTERDAMLELAGVYIETGRLAAATAMLEQVESRLDALPRGAVWGRAQLGYYRGRLALAQGDFVAARDHFTGAIEVFTRHSAKIAMNVLTLIGLVDTELALADHEQAMRRAREALATAESFVEPDELSYLVGHAYAALARAQSGSGQPDAARESLTEALRHLEATLGSEHPATRAASDALHRLCRPDAIDSDSSI